MAKRKISAKEVLAAMGKKSMTVTELTAALQAAHPDPDVDCSSAVVSWRMMSMKKSPYVVLDVSGSPANRSYRVVSVQARFLAASEASQRIADGAPPAPLRDGDSKETAAYLSRAAQINQLWKPAMQAKD